LLNIPPDREGLISDADIRSLRGWRRVMDGTFGVDLTAGAVKKDSGMTIKLGLVGNKPFDVLSLQEDIRVGQRVERWVFEVENHGEWVQVASGTTIGYKRLLRFPPVTANQVRLRVLSSRLDPVIAKIGLYKLAE
jgi:alpha-L-fucosidase